MEFLIVGLILLIIWWAKYVVVKFAFLTGITILLLCLGKLFEWQAEDMQWPERKRWERMAGYQYGLSIGASLIILLTIFVVVEYGRF